MKSKSYPALILISIPFIFLLIQTSSFFYKPQNTPISSNVNSDFHHTGIFCAYVKRAGTDTWQKIGCHHNLLTDNGKDIILDHLAHGNATAQFSNVTWIAVANNTVAQASTDTALQGEWTTCGLARAMANEFTRNGPGNWSIAYTWTVTCDDVIVNATGLYNQTGTLFAETTLPKSILYNGDNYKTTYTIAVS